MTQSPATSQAATWEGRTVLVTGAEGFIGSTLVDRLVDQGATVRAFVHYKPYAERGNLAKYLGDPDSPVTVRAGDLRDGAQLIDAVAGCDTVFHLGALIGIPYSYEAPDSYVQTNVGGTLNVAEACRRNNARLVHTSTSETYGTARTVPIPETHPMQPQSPYSASKIGADMMALSYWHAFELPVSVVRPFNCYGPRQSARAVIPTILGQLHAGITEIKLGSVTPTRDFTFVTDTVDGFLAVASTDRTLGEVVNVGSGREISIGELAELIIEVSGRDAKVITDDSRLRPTGSEVERLLCDTTKCRELTGWSARVGLRDGLRRTSDWVRDHQPREQALRYQV